MSMNSKKHLTGLLASIFISWTFMSNNIQAQADETTINCINNEACVFDIFVKVSKSEAGIQKKEQVAIINFFVPGASPPNNFNKIANEIFQQLQPTLTFALGESAPRMRTHDEETVSLPVFVMSDVETVRQVALSEGIDLDSDLPPLTSSDIAPGHRTYIAVYADAIRGFVRDRQPCTVQVATTGSPSTGVIEYASIMIDADREASRIQECLFDMLLISLGLGSSGETTLETLTSSSSTINQPSYLDAVLLRILYDERVKPGMKTQELRSVFPSIYRDALSDLQAAIDARRANQGG